MTATELAPVDSDRLEAKIDQLSRQVAGLAAEADERRRQRELVSGLLEDVAPLGPDAFALLTERLAEAERRGYFAFARTAAAVADRVVTGFDEDDLAQLGDNVVAVLETLKEITRPELLDLLGHMVDAVRRQQRDLAFEPEEPPSLWALARQARDPDVRRGIARALATLGAVSVETGPDATTDTTNRTTIQTRTTNEKGDG